MPNNVGTLTVEPIDALENTSESSQNSSGSFSFTSELMAINTMLSVIGEMPVSSLTSSEATPAVVIAQNILGEVRRETDSRGWHYNTEQDVVLSPDDEFNVNIPVNIIRLDVKVGNYTSKDIIQRNGRLYDLIAHSYAFTEDIKVDAVYYLAWDELPETAKRYVMIRGARILQDRIIGDQTQNVFTSRDEFMALTDLKEYEGDTGDYTMLDAYAVNKTMFTGPLARIPR